VIQKFVKQEKKISMRKYYIDWSKDSSTTNKHNTIETDIIKLEKQTNGDKKLANILKILLWIEPDNSKGKANSLHEVVFDFQNGINTWVNHREMGKLNPECW